MMIPFARRMTWLTARERTVLAHLMAGLSAGEIAAVEYVAVCTVRSQIRAILQKLGVKSIPAAIAAVYREMLDDHDALLTRVLAVA